MRLPTIPRIPISKIIPTLVMLLIVFGIVAAISLSLGTTTTGVFETAGPTVPASDLPSIKLGTPRTDIERKLGKGTSALDYPETGTALEPINATCTYYPQSNANIRNIIQLCYQNDKLISKHAYRATPGAPLED